MQTTDPAVTFVIILAIGIIAGVIFDRVAGPSWLTRQFAGSLRGVVTSSLIGIAGAFIGFHLAGLLGAPAGLLTLVIASAIGAVVVLWAWRTAK